MSDEQPYVPEKPGPYWFLLVGVKEIVRLKFKPAKIRWHNGSELSLNDALAVGTFAPGPLIPPTDFGESDE